MENHRDTFHHPSITGQKRKEDVRELVEDDDLDTG